MTDLIDRNKALSFPFANGKYDHKHADEHFIAGCEAYREWLKELPSVDLDTVLENAIDRLSHEALCRKENDE